MIEVEVQNETHQNQQCIRFSALPRIGEGLRLLEPDGFWTSYDIIDLWYQKAEFGDIWVPYIHVRMTPSERAEKPEATPVACLDDHQDVIDQTKTIARILSDHENS
ncbi:hypothetical protein [Novosphingobium album (ex Hu et al. 2023)]|uniref:Uncharacterized protein n=1 Tax=Novosphingobium album (ex Hu et al. 2023) TaxID=2930093 RepID=A0ABT0B3P8_9SPHN|nr:hypothetical protein [Novosphingobium album (ex Hu et al. 2023)]MCJ2179675.1 hypothetical protein [Novosphingobium album (ex Hu et al. 2023)]